MEWPVIGPQVISRVTRHPESFLVSHAYLSIWIVDPESLGREDESAWDSTGGRAIQVPHAVLTRLYSTAPWCHWQLTKSVEMQDFAELSRAGMTTVSSKDRLKSRAKPSPFSAGCSLSSRRTV